MGERGEKVKLCFHTHRKSMNSTFQPWRFVFKAYNVIFSVQRNNFLYKLYKCNEVNI